MVLCAMALPQGRALAQTPRGTGVASDLTGGFTVARLKYTGGGDWYSDESSLKNLLRALRERGDIRTSHEKEAVVTATDPELWNYPMLFMTGHGNVKLNDDELKSLRAYLDQGGFLWADDNFGLDVSFRAMMNHLYPETALTELPFTHPLFKSHTPFPPVRQRSTSTTAGRRASSRSFETAGSWCSTRSTPISETASKTRASTTTLRRSARRRFASP